MSYLNFCSRPAIFNVEHGALLLRVQLDILCHSMYLATTCNSVSGLAFTNPYSTGKSAKENEKSRVKKLIKTSSDKVVAD